MIFDGVVSPTFENVGDISPLIAVISVKKEENPFFFRSPMHISFNHRIQVIVPTLSALLPYSPRQMIGNLGPFLGTINVYQVHKESVLDISPRTLYKRWI